jgi:general secretion pathway protein G
MTIARPVAQSLRTLRNDEGMTLLELLVVMVILGLLATLGSVQLMGYLDRAKTQSAKLQIEELVTALELFKLDTGRYPSTSEGLPALVEPPAELAAWQGPYLRKTSILKDPWGRPFIYRTSGAEAEIELVSLGADGSEGGDGDAGDITGSIH